MSAVSSWHGQCSSTVIAVVTVMYGHSVTVYRLIVAGSTVLLAVVRVVLVLVLLLKKLKY